MEQLEEEVQALVDGVVAGLDQAVGVEDQLVAGGQAEGGDFEGDTADPERCAGGQIEQFGGLARAHQHGGQVSGDSDVAQG
ncbi:hypothetical protein OK006_11220, partial [Actinobacteria bacterium OK006]